MCPWNGVLPGGWGCPVEIELPIFAIHFSMCALVHFFDPYNHIRTYILDVCAYVHM